MSEGFERGRVWFGGVIVNFVLIVSRNSLEVDETVCSRSVALTVFYYRFCYFTWINL